MGRGRRSRLRGPHRARRTLGAAGALARRRRAVGMVVAAIAARGEHRVRRRAVAGWPLSRVRRTRRHGRQERAVGAVAAVERARAAPGNRRRIEAVLVARLSPHRFFCERQAADGRYREPRGSRRGCRRRRGRRRHMGTRRHDPVCAVAERSIRSSRERRRARRGGRKARPRRARHRVCLAAVSARWTALSVPDRKSRSRAQRGLRRQSRHARELSTAGRRFGGDVRRSSARAVRREQYVDRGGDRRRNVSS